MEWLSQNWIWLALAIGAYLLMSRGGMGCCGTRHTHHRDHGAAGGPGQPGIDRGGAMTAKDAASNQAHQHHGCC